VNVAVLLIATLAGLGIAAVTRDWIPPFRRGSIARPRLWGYGTLVSDAGLAAFIFLGPYQGPNARPAPFAVAGGIVLAAGVIVQSAAARPTKNAS
jgi:hypothetical protein